MFGQFKTICVLLLMCLLGTPATLQETQQEKGGKGAKCKNPTVRKILPKIQIELLSLSQGWENEDSGTYTEGCTKYTCTKYTGTHSPKEKGIWVDRPDL